jgi:hypothetical protein
VVGEVAVAEDETGLAAGAGAVGGQVRDPHAAGERAPLDRGRAGAALESAE